MISRFNKLYLLLFLLLPELCLSQHYDFKAYALTEGTSIPEISDVQIDWNGNLWVATKGDGLFRFNGSQFQPYNRKDSLAGDYVISILVDSNPSIWAATLSGLSRYDGSSFRNYRMNDGLPDNRIGTYSRVSVEIFG